MRLAEERRTRKTIKGDRMTARERCLSEASKAVLTDRSEAYGGKPENNFREIGRLWSVYLDREISDQDVAVMMILLKTARIKTGRHKDDNWIDVAGYAACGMECGHED